LVPPPPISLNKNARSALDKFPCPVRSTSLIRVLSDCGRATFSSIGPKFWHQRFVEFGGAGPLHARISNAQMLSGAAPRVYAGHPLGGGFGDRCQSSNVRVGSRLFQNARCFFPMTSCRCGWSIFRFYEFVLLMRSSGPEFAARGAMTSTSRSSMRRSAREFNRITIDVADDPYVKNV
jgi:hypothetical protein